LQGRRRGKGVEVLSKGNERKEIRGVKGRERD